MIGQMAGWEADILVSLRHLLLPEKNCQWSCPDVHRSNAPCTIHWTEEGVKIENQNAPLVIRPSRTPKTNPKNNFSSKSLSTMSAKLVVFQPFTLHFDFPFWPPHRFSVFYTVEGWNTKSFAPIVDKDLEQKFFLGLVLGVLEGLITRGAFWFSSLTPSSVQCTLHCKTR